MLNLFVTDMHGQNGRRLLAQKNSKKKFQKKKATNKHNPDGSNT